MSCKNEEKIYDYCDVSFAAYKIFAISKQSDGGKKPKSKDVRHTHAHIEITEILASALTNRSCNWLFTVTMNDIAIFQLIMLSTKFDVERNWFHAKESNGVSKLKEISHT